MRFARSFLALAALCAAAACADGASRITAPTNPSHDETSVESGWAGSGNVTEDGGWGGSGNNTPPADTTNRAGGGWGGTGN
ncbi:MAG TPA: hypothetical protein VK420_09965 [Longimicrobium sp.]|jgi:hypothetical protein|nr:hypothetical protein [Longimicrobium sp.]